MRAIYCNPGYGPTFGGGHDLYICSDCNSSNGSYSNTGYCYEKINSKSGYFTDEKNFFVKNIEGFQIKFD